jgi:hypothetical protein
MDKLKVLILHYYKEIVIPIEKNISNKVLFVIGKLKTKWEFNPIDFPEIGYLGMELYFDNFDKIFINEENILYTYNNITQLLYDPHKKVNDFLLKIILKNNYKELSYFLEVRKLRKNNKR